MSWRIITSDEARDDVRRARVWYESQTKGSGERFLDAVASAVKDIADRPLAFPEVEPDIRRALCKRFPYKVFYSIESDYVYIVGVYHAKRDPRRWREHD